jgi:molybdate transport system regulatory protein
MKLAYNICLENDRGRAFGEGPYRLLKGIEMTGSLWDAAVGMGMAYSKARRVMECCERTLGFALTRRKKGGASGGGSEVTAQAVELTRAYESLRTEIEDVIGEAYKRHFGQSLEVRFYELPRRRKARKK